MEKVMMCMAAGTLFAGSEVDFAKVTGKIRPDFRGKSFGLRASPALMKG